MNWKISGNWLESVVSCVCFQLRTRILNLSRAKIRLELVTWHGYLYSLRLRKLSLSLTSGSQLDTHSFFALPASDTSLWTTWQFSLSHMLVQASDISHRTISDIQHKMETSKNIFIALMKLVYFCQTWVFYTSHGPENHLTKQIHTFSLRVEMYILP